MEESYVDKNREEIIGLLKSTKRKGMTGVIKFLEESEFFIREGSKKHHNYIGGLAEHSLGVYRKALALNRNCDINSLIICSLLHDVCKISHRFTPHECYNGHGSRSIKLLKYLKLSLTDKERRAIRFHASTKGRKYSDKDCEELEIAKNEDLRNLIASCVQIDVVPWKSHIFPLFRLAEWAKFYIEKIPGLIAELIAKIRHFRR